MNTGMEVLTSQAAYLGAGTDSELAAEGMAEAGIFPVRAASSNACLILSSHGSSALGLVSAGLGAGGLAALAVAGLVVAPLLLAVPVSCGLRAGSVPQELNVPSPSKAGLRPT